MATLMREVRYYLDKRNRKSLRSDSSNAGATPAA
jgi:hypothetical protein